MTKLVFLRDVTLPGNRISRTETFVPLPRPSRWQVVPRSLSFTLTLVGDPPSGFESGGNFSRAELRLRRSTFGQALIVYVSQSV